MNQVSDSVRRSRHGQLMFVAFACLSLSSTSCTAEQYSRQADRSATRILDERMEGTLGGRRETVVWPEDAAPEEENEGGEALEGATKQGDPEKVVESVSLARALDIAVISNRDYINRKEDLFLTALSLAEARHQFSPQLSSTLGYLFFDARGPSQSSISSFAAGASQILATGGTISVDGITSYASSLNSLVDDTGAYNSSLSIRLTQPLLRGAGYESSHESLTNAERSMIYAVRDFELFREDFSIDVARRYYDLVQQFQSIENERRNLKDLTFAEDQARALFDVGRTRELDVLRARRNRLNADNRLIEALESYELASDRFRIFLGLPSTLEVDIIKGAPEFIEVNYDVNSAVEVALLNRLDFLNRREQLEDSARAVRLAKDGLLPDLELDASATFPTGPDRGFSNQEFNSESVRLGVSLEIPVDRVTERSNYRRAQIRYAQDQRSFEEFEDDLVVTVESAFRELERRKLSVSIQRQLIEDEQKNVRVAQLRFERGEIPNRDVVEAQQGLLDARNSLIQEQVNYEIARLRLLRDLGIVFIDERGMWTE